MRGGITGDPADAVRLAHQICDEMMAGFGLPKVLEEVETVTHFRNDKALWLIEAAFIYYCP